MYRRELLGLPQKTIGEGRTHPLTVLLADGNACTLVKGLGMLELDGHDWPKARAVWHEDAASRILLVPLFFRPATRAEMDRLP